MPHKTHLKFLTFGNNNNDLYHIETIYANCNSISQNLNIFMASRIHGVPLSTTPTAPKAATFQNLTSGIRAPLTLDESDFEYSASSKSRRNSTTSSYYSGSELESDGGFVSGEDESETDSGRLVVHDPEEEILEETHFVKEFAFSRPLVKNPNGDILQKSSSNSKIKFLGPPVKIPNKKIIPGSGNGSRSTFSGPYISDFKEYDDSDEEIVKENAYVVKYGDSSPIVSVTNKDVVENAIVGVSSVSISHRPVALISGDSDDDVSQGSEVMEDEGFSGVVRVPSIELLQRILSAPKVRILDLEEDQDNEKEDENILERQDNGEPVLNNGVLALKHEEEQINVEEHVECDLLAKISQDEGSDFRKEDISLVVNGENNYMSDSERNVDLLQIDEYKQELDVIDDRRKCIDSGNSREPNELLKDTLLNGHIASVAFGEEQSCSCESVGLEITESNAGDNFEFDQDFKSCNIENKIEGESVVRAMEVNEVPSNDCPRFLELPKNVMESDHVDTLDTVMETCPSDACQLVLSNDLDHGNNSEAEINEQLPRDAEYLTFHNKSVVAEIECEETPVCNHGGEDLRDHLVEIDVKIVRDLDEEVETDGGVSDDSKMIESSVKAASDVSNAKFTSMNSVETFPFERDYTDLVSRFHSTIPVCDEARNAEFFAPLTSELEKALSEGENKKLEQIEQIRVKYLWLLHRLGLSHIDSVAMNHDFDFSLSILVIGKTGAGKSATINSIFGEKKMETSALGPATENVKQTAGTVNGIKVKVLDTPGLRTSLIDQSINHKILSSIKKSIQKSPPDVVLYVDRLDMQTCDFADLPLLRFITVYLGSSIWRKSIIVLTHAAALPPDELFVDQRSSVLQKMIGCLNGSEMNPVSLVENRPLGKMNDCGEKLLFLCYSMKILLELKYVVATNDSLSSSGLSLMRWRGDVISGSNLQSEFGIGTNSKLFVEAEMNGKLNGRVSIRTRGSDQLQIAVLASLLISKALSGNVFPQQKSSS